MKQVSSRVSTLGSLTSLSTADIPGHAYGKSLRTVKSCVGTSWCRFGVGDSVGLAIDLENRYRGVRGEPNVASGAEVLRD